MFTRIFRSHPPHLLRLYVMVSPSRRVTFLLLAQQESNQRKRAPNIRPVTSLRYVTGSLTESLDLFVTAKKAKAKVQLTALMFSNHASSDTTNRPFQQAERRCCTEGYEAWMPSKERWAKDGPSRRPSEQHRSEGTRSAAQDRMQGQDLLVTLTRCPRPAGQPAAVTPLRYVWGNCQK